MKMVEEVQKITDKMCSICFAMDVRIFEFVDSGPKRLIESIFLKNGFYQLISFEKPYICYLCKALLEKTHKFVQKALTAQQVVQEMLVKTSYRLTLEQLKQAINRNFLGLDVSLSKQKINVEFGFIENMIDENKPDLTVALQQDNCVADIDELVVADSLSGSIENEKESITFGNESKCIVGMRQLVAANPLNKMKCLKDSSITFEEKSKCKANVDALNDSDSLDNESLIEIKHPIEDQLNVPDPLDNIEIPKESVKIELKSECESETDMFEFEDSLFTKQNKELSVKCVQETDEISGIKYNASMITVNDTASEDNNRKHVTNEKTVKEKNRKKTENHIKIIHDTDEFSGIKYTRRIITIHDSASEDNCKNVPNEKTVKKKNRNKTGNHNIDTDFDYCDVKKQKRKLKKQQKGKKNMVRVKRADYKPSVFMLSLSSFTEKKRQRKAKKYVYSDEDSDSSKLLVKSQEKDSEYDPASSGNDTEDSMYDRYTDSGRKLKPPDTRDYPMKCDHCEAEIPEKRVHYHHYLQSHPKIEYPYPQQRLNILCQFCGYVSRSNARNTAHELTHSSQRSFACHKCPKRFKNLRNLTKHLHSTHTNKLLECDYCAKNFKTRSDIVLHIRTHTGEKPFKCHICNAGFAHKGNVGIHIRAKHQGLTQMPKKIKKQDKNKRENKLKRRKNSKSQEDDEPIINLKKEFKPKIRRTKKKTQNNQVSL